MHQYIKTLITTIILINVFASTNNYAAAELESNNDKLLMAPAPKNFNATQNLLKEAIESGASYNTITDLVQVSTDTDIESIRDYLIETAKQTQRYYPNPGFGDCEDPYITQGPIILMPSHKAKLAQHVFSLLPSKNKHTVLSALISRIHFLPPKLWTLVASYVPLIEE